MFAPDDRYPGGEQHLVMEYLQAAIKNARRRAPTLPLLFAICAPCQAFTRFVQRSLTDTRTIARRRDEHLLSQTLSFVEEFQPDLIMSENVANIRYGKSARIWTNFRDNLKELDYLVGDETICTSRFGIPQRRRRLILLAIKITFGTLRAELSIPKQDGSSPTRSVRDAIGHFPAIQAGDRHPIIANHQSRALSSKNLLRFAALRPGESNRGLANTEFGDLSLIGRRISTLLLTKPPLVQKRLLSSVPTWLTLFY